MAPKVLKRVFDKTPQGTDCEMLLPPTESSRSSAKLVTYNRPSSAEEKCSHKYDVKISCVQTCPHETPSFERMKRIVHLPYFKYSVEKIEAFTNFPAPNHMSTVAGTHLCKPHPNDFSSHKSNGFYGHQRGYEGIYDSLVLCVYWTVSFADMDFAGSVSSIQRSLDTLDIHLCEYTRMSGLKIAVKI